MPSVNDGRESTGFSRRKVAVEELFLSLIGASELLAGALNWKNSYSAVFPVSDVHRFRTKIVYLQPLRRDPLPVAFLMLSLKDL